MSSWTAGRGYWNYANRVRSGSCPGGTMSKKKKKKKNERRARKKTTRGRIRRSTSSTTSRRRRRRRSTYSRRRRREGKKATYITKRRRLAPLWLLYPKGHNVSPHGAASHADPTTEPHSHPTSYVPLDAATGCTNLSTCPSCSPYTRIYNPPLSLSSTLPSRVESSRVENPGLDLVTINEGYTKEKVARNGLVYEKCWTGRKRGDEIVHRDIRRHRMTDNERPRRYLNTRREC